MMTPPACTPDILDWYRPYRIMLWGPNYTTTHLLRGFYTQEEAIDYAHKTPLRVDTTLTVETREGLVIDRRYL